jgi:hypothetical protein
MFRDASTFHFDGRAHREEDDDENPMRRQGGARVSA